MHSSIILDASVDVFIDAFAYASAAVFIDACIEAAGGVDVMCGGTGDGQQTM